MMASRGLRILGSGTVSTRISPLPYQQTAFILCLPYPASAGHSLRHLRIVHCCWGLTRFDNLFEATQILFELLFGEGLEEVRHCHPHYTAWRCIFELYAHLSATAVREFPETHRAGMVYV